MSGDQVGKLAHQLILLTSTFLDPMAEHKKKAHTCHTIKKAASETIRK